MLCFSLQFCKYQKRWLRILSYDFRPSLTKKLGQELTITKRKCFFLSLARLTSIQLWNIFMVYADMCIMGKHPWCRSLLRKLSIVNINKQNWSKYILRCRHSKTFCTVKNYTTGLTIRGPAAMGVIPSKDWKLRYHLRGILVNRPKTGKKTQYPPKFIKSSYPPKRNLPKFSHQK